MIHAELSTSSGRQPPTFHWVPALPLLALQHFRILLLVSALALPLAFVSLQEGLCVSGGFLKLLLFIIFLFVYPFGT